MGTLRLWPKGQEPSIPRRRGEGESEPVIMYRWYLGKDPDGWPVLVIKRRWTNKQVFLDFIEFRLSLDQAAELHERSGEFLDWVNAESERFEEPKDQEEAA
jgi:hypothetical protein